MSGASQDRILGQIEGKLDRILADQDMARADRKQQYEKLEQIKLKHEATDRKVESIDNRLEKVEEPVAEFSRWRERAIGAIMLVSFASAAFGGLIVTFWKKIAAYLGS